MTYNSSIRTQDIRFTANRLPHWQQKGAVYFVTFRTRRRCSLGIYVRNGNQIVKLGCVRIHNLGAHKSNANITIDLSGAASNGGSMTGHGILRFYGGTIAQPLWRSASASF